MDIKKSIKGDKEDWETVLSYMPEGWEAKAKELGALKRNRNFTGPEPLLRTLMIHLVDGCSLRETTVRANEGEIAEVSDVALLKRLKCAGEWLRWAALGVMEQWLEPTPKGICPAGYNLRVVDGSMISEPGSTGSDWRIHYSINLLTLKCDEVKVTETDVGESLKNFEVNPGDVLIADRGYGHSKGVGHVVNNGGYVLIRINLVSLPLWTSEGQRFPLLKHLRKLKIKKVGDWRVFVKGEKGYIAGRVCAIKKSAVCAEKARQEILREAKRKGQQVGKDTLKAADYTFVFTTLPVEIFDATSVMEIYRCRWQIEISFKRLKSLLGVGCLPKQDVEGARAWLHGKLLAAFLVEALIRAGELFFPWGYPVGKNMRPAKMSMA